MPKIKLVVFDMAGTTVNENNVVYKTVRDVLVEHGVEVTLEQVLEHGAGKEKLQAIKDVLQVLGKEQAVDAFQAYQTFKEKLADAYDQLEVSPVTGTEEVMSSLKQQGIKVVLNTGYKREVAEKLIDKLGWKEGVHYDALITADDVTNGRPHPEMIEKAMALFNITDPSEVLKAGDSAIDIEEGKNANCGVTVGVLSGAQNRTQLEKANPTYIMDNLGSIGAVIFT